MTIAQTVACDVTKCSAQGSFSFNLRDGDAEGVECPEGWGVITLSDSAGELQSHFLCPEHVKDGWALLDPAELVSSTSGCQRRMTSLVSCGRAVVRKCYCQKCIDETVSALREQLQSHENVIVQIKKDIQRLEGKTSP